MKYRWKAKRRHGVHSPFIYELTDKCLRTKPSKTLTSRLNLLQNKLSKNPKTIEITDHGAGSHKMGSTRKLSAIYKNSSSKGKYGEMLFQIVGHYSMKNVLELGTSIGVGTTCLASGNPETNIVTIEGCPNTYEEAVENFKMLGLANVEAICGTFSEVIPTLPEVKYDLIFIDGHHDGTALIHYVSELQKHIHENTFIILDDIRWSKSMSNAWKQFVDDPEYHVTIDLFRMGIVLPRPQQEKEHFVIRL